MVLLILTVTCAPTSPVPENVGVTMLVIPSSFSKPVSLKELKFPVKGLGIVVSTIIEPPMLPAFPAKSTVAIV